MLKNLGIPHNCPNLLAGVEGGRRSASFGLLDPVSVLDEGQINSTVVHDVA